MGTEGMSMGKSQGTGWQGKHLGPAQGLEYINKLRE